MARANAKLSDEQRIRGIQHLACFKTSTETLHLLKQEWPSIDVTVQAIDALSPLTYAGRNLAKRWRVIFDETRKVFLADITRIGIANPAVRLEMLAGVATRAAAKKNDVLLMSALEQAAKESGGAYTNRLQLTGKDGAPIAQTVEHQVTAESVKSAMGEVLSWLK